MRSHNIYFTSDHHFNHRNIIDFCNRPFTSVEEMNEHMIDAWNSVVKKGDMVYHLGDFAITGYSKSHVTTVENLLSRLNGNKILIKGNHDSDAVLKAKGWANIHNMYHVRDRDKRFILCHYAMRTWQFKAHGSIHLYGHSHANLPDYDRSMDVGVDNVGYVPLLLEEILDKFEHQDIGCKA